MDAQIGRPHGDSYEHNTHDATLQADEDQEQYHEKKSVLKKVKAKAKKIKDTIVHGHGHNHEQHEEDQLHHVPDDHDLDEEDDDEDDEMVDSPQVRGTSSVVTLDDPEVNNKRPTAMTKDYSGDPRAEVGGAEKSSASGNKEDDGGLRVAVGQTRNIEEKPQAPLNTHVSVAPGIMEQAEVANPTTSARKQDPTREHPEINLEMLTGLQEDPHSPRPEHHSDPSNYQTKVTDPTGSGSEEADVIPILQSFDKMNISSELKPSLEENLNNRSPDESMFPTGSHDQFSPERTPPIPTTSQESDHSVSGAVTSPTQKQGSYSEKISCATSAIADRAISAKNIVVSKLGYDKEKGDATEREGEEQQQRTKTNASPSEYEKKMAATVSEKLTSVYEKVAETSSTVMSKVPGMRGSPGNDNGEAKVKGQDRGVSVKDYFAEKLKPGDEDKALSEVISEALHKRKEETKKEDKPMGVVTESEEVRQRLGEVTGEENRGEIGDESSVRVSGGILTEKIKGAVGSLFGGGKGLSAGSFTGTGSHSTRASVEEAGEKRLQESMN